MMAKMFYTMEEAKATLGKSEEEVKQYAREGRLREFRDGPRLMFKADQVEQLKSELATGGVGPDLGVSDSGGLIGLVDTTGASGTSITLSEADTGQSSVAGMGGLGASGTGMRLSPGASGSAIPLAGTGTGMSLSGTGGGTGMGMSSGTGIGMTPSASGTGMSLKGDTGLAVDLGLSGSLGGVPSPGRPGGTQAGGSVGGAPGRSGAGVNVFSGDEIEGADPGAQTAISAGIREQVNLEGVGSGSGLLDLTRESDDTSLGAVLDEITPGRRGPGDTATAGSGTGLEQLGSDTLTTTATGRRTATAAAPVYVQQMDPMAMAFGAMALAGFAVLLFGMFVLISAIVGASAPIPAFLNNEPFYKSFGAALGVVVVFFIVGAILGRVGRR